MACKVYVITLAWRPLDMVVVQHSGDPTVEFPLVRKNRPDWQAGFWNLPGGHVEPNEEHVVAASRELQEETGIYIPRYNLFPFAEIEANDKSWIVYCYQGRFSHTQKAERLTDEAVAMFTTAAIPERALFNLRYLIPMALDVRLAAPIRLTHCHRSAEDYPVANQGGLVLP